MNGASVVSWVTNLTVHLSCRAAVPAGHAGLLDKASTVDVKDNADGDDDNDDDDVRGVGNEPSDADPAPDPDDFAGAGEPGEQHQEAGVGLARSSVEEHLPLGPRGDPEKVSPTSL